jgi:hypothetical protein
MRTTSSKDIQHNKKTVNISEEVEQYFPSFVSFIEIQNNRYQDL